MSNDALDREVAASDAGSRYAEVQQSAEFQELRRRFRRFVFPMTALFLAWYFLYVLLSSFAVDFMSTKVFGNINVGLIFGLLPVRLDVRHHDHLRPLGGPPLRPRRRGAS